MKVRKGLAVCLLLVAPAVLAIGQEEKAGRRDPAGRRQATTTVRDTTSDNASQDVSSHFATMLVIKNQEEIELAKFAMEKTQNDQVREFAKKLVDDHSKFIQQLQQFNPKMEFATLHSEGSETLTSERVRTNRGDQQRQPNRNRPNQDRQSDQGQDDQQDQPGADQDQADQDQADQADQNGRDQEAGRRERGEEAGQSEAISVRRTTTTAAGGDHQSVHMQVARDAAQICLDMTKEKLGSKQGADFDRCYVGGAIVAHVGMISKMQAMQKHAPTEFGQVLEKGIATSNEHLKHAEMLAKQLEGQHGGAGGAELRSGAAGGDQDADRNQNQNQNENREENTNPDANPNQ